jgi:hypothetical protein
LPTDKAKNHNRFHDLGQPTVASSAAAAKHTP